MKRWKIFFGLVVVAVAFAIGIHFYISSSAKPMSVMKEVVKKPEPVVYLALGDSTCTGVGAKNGGYAKRLFAYIEKERPSSRMIAPCVSGARSENVVREQLKNISQTKPTLVTVGIGANDVTNFVDIEHFTHNFDEIISRLKRETDATLIVMNIPDVSLAPIVPDNLRGIARERVVAFNKRIDEIASRNNLEVVDLYSKSREFSLRHEFFSGDGFHPSDEGYDFWAKELWVYVETAINEN